MILTIIFCSTWILMFTLEDIFIYLYVVSIKSSNEFGPKFYKITNCENEAWVPFLLYIGKPWEILIFGIVSNYLRSILWCIVYRSWFRRKVAVTLGDFFPFLSSFSWVFFVVGYIGRCGESTSSLYIFVDRQGHNLGDESVLLGPHTGPPSSTLSNYHPSSKTLRAIRVEESV